MQCLFFAAVAAAVPRVHCNADAPLQRVAVIRLDCPNFGARCPVFPALSIRRHIDDANIAQVA